MHRTASFLKKVCCVLNLPLPAEEHKRRAAYSMLRMYVHLALQSLTHRLRLDTMAVGICGTISHVWCGEGPLPRGHAQAMVGNAPLHWHRSVVVQLYQFQVWYEASARKKSSCAPPRPHRCTPLLDALHLNSTTRDSRCARSLCTGSG